MIEQPTVYVLQSVKDGKTYVGSAINLSKRFAEHQRGEVKATVNRRPLNILYTENYATIAEARKRERFLKTTSGRRALRKILQPIIAG